MSSQLEVEEAVRLPELTQGATKDPETEMRQWLAERRAKRRSSDESTPLNSNLLLPMGRNSLPLNHTSTSVSPISTSASLVSDRSGDTNERMERWLKSRKSVRMDMNDLKGPLDILSRITSPIKTTDENENTRESFSRKNENTESNSETALQPHPPSDEPRSATNTPTRTAMAQSEILSQLSSHTGNKEATSVVERPRSFYREYLETQKKREQRDAEAAAIAKEIAEQEAARASSQELVGNVASDSLNVIPEDEEIESDEEEVYDTGAAASALMRMQEMHNEMQAKDKGALGRKNRNSVNKTSNYSAKRGSQLRKNSEARNAGVEEIVAGGSGPGPESRKNSRAQNNMGIFGGRKQSNKPITTPARSQRTVMKRFTDGKTELDQKLSEKELAAREQLQARLEKRNKQMAELAAKRRQSEKGWK